MAHECAVLSPDELGAVTPFHNLVDEHFEVGLEVVDILPGCAVHYVASFSGLEADASVSIDGSEDDVISAKPPCEFRISHIEMYLTILHYQFVLALGSDSVGSELHDEGAVSLVENQVCGLVQICE